MVAKSKNSPLLKYYDKNATSLTVLISFFILYTPFLPIALYGGRDLIAIIYAFIIESKKKNCTLIKK